MYLTIPAVREKLSLSRSTVQAILEAASGAVRPEGHPAPGGENLGR